MENKYLIFGTPHYYPAGGLNDMLDCVDTLEEVVAIVKENFRFNDSIDVFSSTDLLREGTNVSSIMSTGVDYSGISNVWIHESYKEQFEQLRQRMVSDDTSWVQYFSTKEER